MDFNILEVLALMFATGIFTLLVCALMVMSGRSEVEEENIILKEKIKKLEELWGSCIF